jgi:ankyrin repeat protein
MSLSTVQVGRRDYLSRLPVEMLLQIGKFMESDMESDMEEKDGVQALAALCLTSRKLHSVFIQLLYKFAGSSAMVWGAFHGRIDVMEKALSFGTNVNTPGNHRAIEKEFDRLAHDTMDIDIVDFNNYISYYGTPPLTFAVLSSKPTAVDWLLDRGADTTETGLEILVQPPDSPWDSPEKRLSIARALLEHGAVIDGTNAYLGESPLEQAVVYGDYTLAGILLDLGAKSSQWLLYRMLKSLKTEKGWEPQSEAGEALFRRLAGEGGRRLNRTYRDPQRLLGDEPLNCLMAFLRYFESNNSHFSHRDFDGYGVALMCELGADPNARDSMGMTAMHWAIDSYSESIQRNDDAKPADFRSSMP